MGEEVKRCSHHTECVFDFSKAPSDFSENGTESFYK